MRKKSKSKSQIIEEAAVLMQKYVRLKAADENGYVSCVTCGTTKLWNDGMQGGHYIPRKHIVTKLLEENIHPQCSYCNGPLDGNRGKYALYLEDMYGREYVEWLESQRQVTTHYTKTEAYEKLEEVKELMRRLEDENI